MDVLEEDLNLFVNYLLRKNGGGDDKWREIQEYYEYIIVEKMDRKQRLTFLSLLHCKNFEEAAEEFTKKEKRKKPLTISAIRKRWETSLKIVKKALTEKFVG